MLTSDTPQPVLNAKQAKALSCLLVEPTIDAAAEKAGVSVSSLLRWLKEDGFSASYREARREVVSHAVTQLQGACGDAVATLREIATDSSKPAASRVSAARAILDTSQRAIEVDDLGARVEALEAILKEKSDGRN